MSTRRGFNGFRGVAVAACALGLMLSSGAAPANAGDDPNNELSKDEQKCVVEANKNLSKVVKAQGKDIVNCIKNGGKGKTDKLGGPPGTIQSCTTDDVKGKVLKATGKLTSKVGDKCLDQSPAFGTNVAGSAPDTDALITVATTLTQGLHHAIFGSNLDAAIVVLDKASDKDPNDPTNTKLEGKCQTSIAKNSQKCLDTKWKIYNKCKKNALKGKTGPPAQHAADLEVCVASVQSDAKVTKTCLTKFVEKMGKKCGEVDLGNVLPGSGVANAAGIQPYADARVECQFCKMANLADSLEVDCDGFDDGDPNNASCGDGFIDTVCVLNSTVGESDAVLTASSGLEFALSQIGSTIEGKVGIECGVPDANGVATCSCSLIGSFVIILPAGLGTACLTGHDGCDPGTIDCDGGEPQDVAVFYDHDAGGSLEAIVDPNGTLNDPNTVGTIPFCGLAIAGQDPNTGPAQCAAICEAYCPLVDPDYTVLEARCEGYCRGGDFDGQECTANSILDPGVGGCTLGGADFDNGGECVGGSSSGAVAPKHPHNCSCICSKTAGAPGGPGDFSCELGLRTVLTNNEDCALLEGEVISLVGDQCQPSTTATITSEQINTDLSGVTGDINVTQTGNTLSCANLSGGVLTGIHIWGVTASGDGDLGDLSTQSVNVCE